MDRVSILTLLSCPVWSEGTELQHATKIQTHKEKTCEAQKQNLIVHSQAGKYRKKIKCSLSLRDGLGVLWSCTKGGGEKRMREQSLISWKRRCEWCCTTGDKAFVLGVRPVKRPAAEARWLEWWCDAGEVGADFGGGVGQSQSNQWLKGEQAEGKVKIRIRSKLNWK